MNTNPYQPPRVDSSATIENPNSDGESLAARSRLLKQDTVSLAIWLAIYTFFTIVLKLMIDGLYQNYQYPTFQIVVGLAAPMTAFLVGIIANILQLNSVGLGRRLATFRVGLSSIVAVVSVPVLGFESQLTVTENATGIMTMTTICVCCLFYYRYYLRVVDAR